MDYKTKIQNVSLDYSDDNAEFFESVRLIEALLFASSKPLSLSLLQSRISADIPITKIIEILTKNYEARGVNLTVVAGGVAFRTATDLSDHLRKSISVRKRLSSAAIETMAIIAYHQPVTRGDIESIRGVAVSKGTLDTLLEAGWIMPKGRRKVPGRPLQWGTNTGFLDHFGLESLADLPGMEELKSAGFLQKRQSLTSLILPDDILEEEEDEQEEQDELFSHQLNEVDENISDDP